MSFSNFLDMSSAVSTESSRTSPLETAFAFVLPWIQGAVRYRRHRYVRKIVNKTNRPFIGKTYAWAEKTVVRATACV